jgi:hypothetical protein
MKPALRRVPMMPMMTRAILLVSLLVAACGGSTVEPTNGATSPDGDSGAPVADADVVGGSLDATCDGVAGLTGRSVLDAIGPFPTATFRRFVYPPGPPKVGDPSPLTLRVSYEGGDVHCTPATPDPPGTLNPSVTPASVSLNMRVEFSTADGLFNESFVAPVTKRSPGSATVQFDVSIEVAAIRGSYKAIAESDAHQGKAVKFFALLTGNLAGSSGGVVHDGQVFGTFDFK